MGEGGIVERREREGVRRGGVMGVVELEDLEFKDEGELIVLVLVIA